MKHLKIFFLALAATLVACSSDENGNAPATKTTVGGIVEKGPFVQGSKVTLYDLDDEMTPTGRQFSTTTSNDLGNFSFTSPIQLSGHYAELETSGYFYNECDSTLSTSQITLRAVTDLSQRSNVNVNIVTHLEYDRVKQLVKDGSSFSDAKQQAEKEIMKVFAIPYTLTSPENISLTAADDNASALLAISAIMLANRTEAEFTEVLAKFCADFKDNGVIDSQVVRDSIASGQKKCHPEAIARAMKRFYAEKGSAVQVSDFSKFVDFNGDGVIDDNDKEDVEDELAPDAQITDQSIFVSESIAGAYIANIYVEAWKYISMQNSLDERRLTDGHSPIKAYDSDVYSLWATGYNIINRANYILYTLGTGNVGYDKTPYMSEASALLAFIYYNMAAEWGSIPYVTLDMSVNPELAVNVLPLTAEQIYDVCLNLLNDAQTLKNEQYHVSTDFVLALQAELRLATGYGSAALSSLESINSLKSDVFSFYATDDHGQASSAIGIYTKSYLALLKAEASGSALTTQQLLERKGSYGTFAALQRSGYLNNTHERLLPIPSQELKSNPMLMQNEGY